MKKFIFLIALLHLIPITLAASLFDDFVNDGETFNVGDHSFYVRYVESVQKLNFKMDGTGGMLLAGECETRDDIKYCFEEVSSTQLKVKILSLEPNISIERSFSTTSPAINEIFTVTVTLKNDGDKTATNIHYSDTYPQGLKVFSDKNAGEWQGSLAAGEDEQFTYTIKAEEIISFDSIASLSYEVADKKKTTTSSAVKIEVQKPFKIEDVISTETADKNEVVAYNITITNQHQSNKLEIESLEIAIPSQLEVVSFPDQFKSQDKKLTFKGTIEKKDTKSFIVKVKSSRVGTFLMHTYMTAKMGGKNFKEESEKSFNIGLSSIILILDMNNTVKSNSPYNVYIGIKNTGKEDLKNVSILVESDLFDKINEKKDMPQGSTSEIFKKTFTAPYVEKDKKYNIKVSGKYTSPSKNKDYTFEKSAQLTMKAAPNVIKIIREFNKEEFSTGDEIKVTIKLQNQKNEALTAVDVSDAFPFDLRSSLRGDVVGYLDTLNASQEKTIYSYSLEIPPDYKKDKIEFKTIVNVRVNGELVILKRIDNIKVIPLLNTTKETSGEQKEETNKTKTEEINQTTTPISEQKTAIFSRIINWIKNLFKKREN